MSTLKDHCEDCVKELGEDFRYVHEWLDELFLYVGPDHRDYRHNWRGIEEVRRRWGGKLPGQRRFKSEEMKNRRNVWLPKTDEAGHWEVSVWL